jgi:hypothetical protein
MMKFDRVLRLSSACWIVKLFNFQTPFPFRA